MLTPSDFEPFPRTALEQSIARRFEYQAARFGARPAIGDDGSFVSYAELDRWADAVARAAREHTEGAPARIAVLCTQGAPLVAGILGALKANAAYVPLDRAEPTARLARLLEHADAALLLTDAASREAAYALAGEALPVLELEEVAQGEPRGGAAPAAAADTPAYVYYTSGTTGPPKGVLDTQRNVLHNVMRYTNSLHISPSDRLTLLPASHLSGAVSSLLGALLNGASVYPFDVAAHSAAELADYLVRERITIYHSVPAIFRSFLADGRCFPGIRVVRLEGDRASRHDVELFRAHFSASAVLVNGLGSTEAGLVRQHFVGCDTPVEEGVLPVGGPVEDMEVLVLDEQGRAAAPTAVGEIAVRSEFLAAGYWRAPELTTRAFAPDPAGGPRRVYRSGDVGRLRADGCLEVLGRRDGRVKVRGQSVELAEVEAALLALPAVRDAAAGVREDADGASRLVAWVVPASPAVTVSALRTELARRLPPAAVPSRFVFLASLPLAASRKLDRGALPAPGPERPVLESAYAAPTNALESLLVHLWEEVLGLAPIGIRDEFLDLGGDSLAALAMLERVEASLARPVSTALLASAATVEALALALLAEQPPDLRAPLVPLRQGGSKRPFVFLHGDYWSDGLYCLHAARHLDPERPFWLLSPCGLDGAPIPESIEAMAEAHLRTLRRAQPHGPYLLGGNCNGGLAAFELARRLAGEGEHVALLVVVRASAGGVRYRLHAAAARVLMAALRRPREEGLLWRERLVGFAEAFRGADAAGRARLVRDKLERVPGGLFGPLPGGQLFGEPPSAAASDEGEATASGEGEVTARSPGRARRERLRDAFTRAASLYVPRPYGGRVTLLWPERDDEAPADALRSWTRVARDVELRVLPGDHLSYATKHVEAFARELDGCLARSDGTAGPTSRDRC